MANAIYIDDQLLQEAERILEEIGLDATAVTKMTLKRVVRDGGISFLVTDLPKIEVQPAASAPSNADDSEQNRVTKNIAINLFKKNGVITNNNVTFASKNKAGNYYWANPLFGVLKQDWYLILNDWIKKELHIFKVPAKNIKPEDMVCRADNEEKVDLQVIYNDTTFTDSRSKISFSKYLIKTIQY